MTKNSTNEKESQFERGYNILIAQGRFSTDGKFLYHYDGLWRRIDGENCIRNMRSIIKNTFKDISPIQKVLSNPGMAKRLYDALKTSPDIPEIHPSLKNSPLVALENGRKIIDLTTMTTRSIEKGDHQFWAFNYAYQPKAKWSDAPKFCEFVKTSIGISLDDGDKSDKKRMHFLEIIAYLCTNIFGAKKMVVLLGPPSCGKSVLLSFLKKIVGKGNYVPLGLTDLGDKFRAQLLENTHLIINDELSCRGVRNLDILKKVISGEDLIVEKKKGTPFSFRPTVKVVFAANQLPQLAEYDSDNAFAERITVLRFGETIPRDKWELNLAEQLFAERDVIISCVLNEVRAFLTKPTAFTEDEEGIAVLHDYENENDSANQFIHDEDWCLLQKGGEESELRVSVKALFVEYCRYCNVNGMTPATLPVFRQQMAQLGFKITKARYARYRDSKKESLRCFKNIGLKQDIILNKGEQK